jgi:glycosyltransferase involved in cell wall biosynthesis
MNIAIICSYPFPMGFAATNRILSYSQGLTENNNKVKIIICRPTERINNIVNSKTAGNYTGIDYQYSWYSTIWPANYVKKITVFLLSFFTSIIILIKDNNIVKIDCIISSIDFGFMNLTLSLLAKLINCKIVYIVDEYPYPLRYDRKPSLVRIMSIRYLFRVFDGMIVMTNTLKEYFKDKVRKDAKFLVMPMTVESERFLKNISKSPIEGNYIAYAGDLSRNKVSVGELIKAFQLISKDFPELKLCIVGYTKSKSEKDELIKIISDRNLKERIILTGRIDRELIPCYLNNAVILAMVEPDSFRSRGCFPTKLGEFLSTGRPVVCTAVGEIPFYLTDGVNAFLVEPDNIEKFAGKMKYVLKNPLLADKVGNAGQKVAMNVFNYKVQTKRMNEFLNEL